MSDSSSSCWGLNNNDEAFIGFMTAQGFKYGIWAKDKPLAILEADFMIHPRSFKNSLALVSWEPNQPPSIWTQAAGVQKLDVTSSLPNIKANTEIFLIDANDLGQIIGRYKTKDRKYRSFIWEEGKTIDFNIDDELFARGYQVIDIYVEQINNNGNMVGTFTYGHKHPIIDKWVQEGEKVLFFWNGQMHFINTPQGFFEIASINNNDEVLLTAPYPDELASSDNYLPKCYLWRFDSDLRQIIEGFIPHWPLKYSDNGQILAMNPDSQKTFICDNGVYIGIEDIIKNSTVSNPHSFFMNNNGVIVGQCHIGEESHAFMLRPEKK